MKPGVRRILNLSLASRDSLAASVRYRTNWLILLQSWVDNRSQIRPITFLTHVVRFSPSRDRLTGQGCAAW